MYRYTVLYRDKVQRGILTKTVCEIIALNYSLDQSLGS
jgi:hypothetical protein